MKFHTKEYLERKCPKGREITSDNFYLNTVATWSPVPESQDPFKDMTTIGEFQDKSNFLSPNGSAYIYTDQGVYRNSDHWGDGIASCDWYLPSFNGRLIKEKQFGKKLYKGKPTTAFCKWKDFFPREDFNKIHDAWYITYLADFTLKRNIELLTQDKDLVKAAFRSIVKHGKPASKVDEALEKLNNRQERISLAQTKLYDAKMKAYSLACQINY
jgi:hypothetical protein